MHLPFTHVSHYWWKHSFRVFGTGFDKRGGGGFFATLLTPPPPTSLKTSKKWVSNGGGLGGSGPKTHWGMCLLDKMMILQGVKLTIQPLEVGYANRPKKAQNGGVCGVSICF